MTEKKLTDGLEKQTKEIEVLIVKEIDSPEFKAWETKTARLLERIFGKGSSYLKDFQDISYSLSFFTTATPDCEFEEAYRRGLKNAEAVLNSIIEDLKEFGIPTQETKLEKSKSNNVTVNLNQNLNINVNNILENNLTVNQYKELKEVLEIKDPKEKESKLSDFLVALSSSGAVEILKTILMGA